MSSKENNINNFNNISEKNKIRISKITEILNNQFSPEQLEIIDDSAKHIGHAGAKTGMGHFSLIIKSKSFENLSLLQSHRAIYKALGSLMQTDIHALRISII